MFNQILTIFQGFFSKSFWFGSFLPVLVIAAIHTLLAALQFPQTVRLSQWLGSPIDTLAWFPVAFVGIVLIAYAMTPLIPLFRGWLDGSQLPEWLYDLTRRERIAGVRKVRADIQSALEQLALWQRKNRELNDRLIAARRIGQATGTANAPASVQLAETEVVKLEKTLNKGRIPELNDVETVAIPRLVQALENNAASLPANNPGYATARKLDQIQIRMLRVIEDCTAGTRQHLQLLWSRNADLAIDNPQATRVGDVMVLIKAYSLKVYGVDYDFLWPRLQLVLPEQGGFADRLTAARALVDFAVLSFVLFITVPIIWLPLLAVTATTPWLFLAVGIASPFAIRFFYELPVRSQIALGEIVRVAVDRYRLDTLTRIMRQPLPATLAAERDLWARLQSAEQMLDSDLVYRHPAAAT